MEVNSNIFCNSPWYELHIYWNGDYGFCCQQFDPPYKKIAPNPYNISKMSIKDWHDSKPMRDARMQMFKDQRWSNCSACWEEEDTSQTSRRHRANQKSIIFRQQFKDSLEQSPGYPIFKYSINNQGATQRLPVDIHVDLGNYCNLACKMCWSGASSKIATQEKKWGTLLDKNHLGNDWTKDSTVWKKFLSDIETMPVQNIHFMGGETLIQPRFHEFIDYMIAQGKTDLNISFVTNGTSFNKDLVNKLTKFNRIGIEVSIEAISDVNKYVRQGTDTQIVLDTIDQYLEYANERISVTVRPAVSALTIRDYYQLIEYCIDKKLLMKTLVVTSPASQNIAVLPLSIRKQYRKNYEDLLSHFDQEIPIDFNESDPSNHVAVLKGYTQQAIALLDQPKIDNEELLKELVDHMKKWDKVYGYNAREIYPELAEILDQHEY